MTRRQSKPESKIPSEWRPVINPDDRNREPIPGYAARNDGTIFRLSPANNWIPLRVKVRKKNGFHQVSVMVDGRRRELGVAGIILRAFVGPRPLGFEPLHFPDPDQGNNRLDNLRWAPNGSSKIGKQFGKRPDRTRKATALDESEVPYVRNLYRHGFVIDEIAERLSTSTETIRRILIGETFRHVPDPLGPIVMRSRRDTAKSFSED